MNQKYIVKILKTDFLLTIFLRHVCVTCFYIYYDHTLRYKKNERNCKLMVNYEIAIDIVITLGKMRRLQLTFWMNKELKKYNCEVLFPIYEMNKYFELTTLIIP